METLWVGFHTTTMKWISQKSESHKIFGFQMHTKVMFKLYCSLLKTWELDCQESWALKNWCFWTVVLEKTLESPLDYKGIQPVNPKGNQSEYSLERLMLKLKLQYSGHLMWRTNSLEKTLMLGKIEGRRRRGWQRMRWLDDNTDLMELSLGNGQGGLASLWPPLWRPLHCKDYEKICIMIFLYIMTCINKILS